MVKKKGGKRSAKHIKEMLEASYQDSPSETIDGFVLDKQLSNKTGKVYYNPTTNEANVVHRGTSGSADWLNNLAYGLGAYELTSRYKTGKRTQDRAEKKYGKKNISTIGHSQGAVLARKLGKDTKEIINVNPAYTFENPSKNEYNVRSSTDVVSSLYGPVSKARSVLYPKYSKKHDITIPSKSALNVLGEHSYQILDRLGEDKEIGAGGRRYKQLGYNGDDIDWIGGSVGTPYINQGTNPYGVKGGTTYAQRLARRTRNTFKPVEKAFKPVEKTFDKAGKTLQSGFAKMGMAMGDLTNNYLLPATVAIGKPIYDATAEGASTLLTGNPVLGKVVADSLWNNMVAKQGYDPRKNQKSKLLGEISGETGKAVAKPFQGAVFGAGKNEMFGGASYRQLGIASAMRTYTYYGSPEFYLLSDIVHSADKNDPENSLFRDQSLNPDPNIEKIIEAMYPTFAHQLYIDVNKNPSLPPADKTAILNDILADYPDANKHYNKDNIFQRYGLWGTKDPIVQGYLRAVSVKPRRTRGSTTT